MTLLDHALQWAAEGHGIFPVRGKVPIDKGGFKVASTDPDVIAEQLSRPGVTGYGIAPADGHWVLDVDPKNGGVVPDDLPPTRTVRTGSGGWHLYFVGSARQGANVAGPGLDTRVSGRGYVLGPGSLHPDTGKPYELVDDSLPARAPGWLSELVAPKQAPAPAAPLLANVDADTRRWAGLVEAADTKIRNAPEGARNDTLNREAFALGGLVDAFRGDVAQAIAILEDAALAAGQPPSTARRAFVEGRGKPQQKPADRPFERPTLDAWVPGPDVEEAPSEHPHMTHDGQPLIVLVGSTAWFIKRPDARDYVQVAREVLRQEFERLHPGLPTTYDFQGQQKAMGPAMLFERYGRRADSLVYSYHQDSEYRYGDANGGTLLLRCCRQDPGLVPAWSDDVHEWLGVLVGEDRRDLLYDWLATSLDLSRPTSALYLQGPRSCGKGMFVSGFARIWGHAIADYGDAAGITSPFNGVLKDTPVIWLDERAPPSPNGSARFRKLTGNSVIDLTQKNKPAATLVGCPRLPITANNADALRFGEGEALTREDEDAIALRVLHFAVRPEAADYLERRGGRSHTAAWVNDEEGGPGRIPRHVAWLAANWTVRNPGTRFLVDGSPGDWFRNAHLRSGLTSTILDAIGQYMSSRDTREACEPDPPCRFDERYPGHVLVSNVRLRACWGPLLGEQRVPTHNAVSDALARLAPNGRERVSLSDGSRPWVYSVPMSALADRVETSL